MQFVPLWTDILEGPSWKIMDLPADQYRFWTFCLMAAQRHDFADGYLPDDRTLAHWFHMDRDTFVTLRDQLVTCGLIDRDDDRDTPRYRMHDWDEWRAIKDPGAKDRKRKQRARDKGVTEESRGCHAAVTPPSQDVTPQITSLISHQASNITPLPPGGGVCVNDGLEPFDPGPAASGTAPPEGWTAEHQRVLDRNTIRFGSSNGDRIVSDLLKDFSPRVVAAACDAHHADTGGAIDGKRLRGICRAMHDGRWKIPGTGKAPAPCAPPVHKPFPRATPEDEAWMKQREENLRVRMLAKREAS